MTRPDFLSDAAPRTVSVEGAFLSRCSVLHRDAVSIRDRTFKHCRFLTTGSVYDADGRIVALSGRDGGRVGDHVIAADNAHAGRDDMAAAPLIPGRSLFLGYFMNHYGHFLTETLSRLWSWKTFSRFDTIVFLPFIPQSADFQVFHHHFLDRLDFPKEKIRILSEPTRFESLVVPEQLWIINHRTHASLRDLYGHIAASHRGRPVPDRVFLSRLQELFPRIGNVEEVEGVFRAKGFEIVYPETLHIDRQMEIYANCGLLAGFSGSALHNVVFARAGTRTIELGDVRTPDDVHVMQRMANALSAVVPYHIRYRRGAAGADTGHIARSLDGCV